LDVIVGNGDDHFLKFLSDISDLRKSLSDHLDEIEKQTVEEMVSVEQNLQVELKNVLAVIETCFPVESPLAIQLLLQDWYYNAFL
jgi:hypothetical protein